jgi:aminobenzoyl-glutamate utilization protein B
MTKTVAEKYIEKKADELKELSLKIWEHPEVAYEEVQASKWTADYLEANGFEVEREYAGVPTAIKASWGKGKPVIGLLGEYDALPGMSQKVKADKDPIKKGAPGQACGHNMLGVAHVGAALGIKKELEENNLEGTVIFYGCPAEEVLTGKVFMARNGAFKELDLSFAFHPGTENRLTTGRMVAMNSVKFHFHGVTAHAGGDPHNGRSALDGVELLNVSANYLREHVTDDVRIHYSITNGGPAPNIVPDYASVWYFVRALTRETVDDTYNRLVKAAKGAAMATETEVEIEFLGGCYNTLQNKELVNLVHDTIKDTELPSYTDEELEFAQKMNLTSPKYKQMLAEGKAKEDIPIANYISPIAENNGFGSTDVGDVQHIAPGVMFTTATHNIAAPGHSWQITASSGSSYGQKGMLYASKVMAKAAMKAIKNPSIIEKAKEEFNEVMGNKEYECPIPKDVPIPGKEN